MSPTKPPESASARGGGAKVEQHLHMNEGIRATEKTQETSAVPTGWRSIAALLWAVGGVGVGSTGTAVYVTVSSRPASAAQLQTESSDISVLQSLVAGIKVDQGKMIEKQSEDHDKILEMRGDVKAILNKLVESQPHRR